ncbi:nucleotidyltransferase family protein [Enterococcus sp. LJL98]
MTTYEEQLKEWIAKDDPLYSLLAAVEKLNLNDAWICAGAIRNKVWDMQHQQTTPLNDIDVIYFDPQDVSWEREKELEEALKGLLPNQPWSVKNQARMHVVGGFVPFTSSYDGVSHFPETPTAVAARSRDGQIEIMAPYGLEDLFTLQVRPTPYYQVNRAQHAIYLDRTQKKAWQAIWQDLSIRTQ